MATKQQATVTEPGGQVVPTIKPGTPEMAEYLALGYGMTLEQAQTIIKERPERPELWPYAMYEKAQAFVAAYEGKPEAVSTRRAWRLMPHPPQASRRRT